jgi:hypothetical protein
VDGVSRRFDTSVANEAHFNAAFTFANLARRGPAGVAGVVDGARSIDLAAQHRLSSREWL